MKRGWERFACGGKGCKDGSPQLLLGTGEGLCGTAGCTPEPFHGRSGFRQDPCQCATQQGLVPPQPYGPAPAQGYQMTGSGSSKRETTPTERRIATILSGERGLGAPGALPAHRHPREKRAGTAQRWGRRNTGGQAGERGGKKQKKKTEKEKIKRGEGGKGRIKPKASRKMTAPSRRCSVPPRAAPLRFERAPRPLSQRGAAAAVTSRAAGAAELSEPRARRPPSAALRKMRVSARGLRGHRAPSGTPPYAREASVGSARSCPCGGASAPPGSPPRGGRRRAAAAAVSGRDGGRGGRQVLPALGAGLGARAEPRDRGWRRRRAARLCARRWALPSPRGHPAERPGSGENRGMRQPAPPGERYGLRPTGVFKNKTDATMNAWKEFKRLDGKSGVHFQLKHRFSGDLLDG